TEVGAGTETLYGAERDATDYLARPFSPPMLRTRVRAWLARTVDAPGPAHEALPASSKLEPPATAVREESSSERLPDILAAMPLFSALTLEQRGRLVERVSDKTFAPGHIIVWQDDPATEAYVIVFGSVCVLESAV